MDTNIYLDNEADNHWLLLLHQNIFNDNYDEEYFTAGIDCDLSTDTNWDIEEVNPVFAITDGETYVAVQIYSNGTIYASGNDDSNMIPVNEDTFETEASELLNNPSKNNALFGFDWCISKS